MFRFSVSSWWFRFGRFVLVVSVVSFQPFRVVFSGFSTCRNQQGINREAQSSGMHDLLVNVFNTELAIHYSWLALSRNIKIN